MSKKNVQAEPRGKGRVPRFYPEWAPAAKIFLGWPARKDLWGRYLLDAQKEMANLVDLCRSSVNVDVIAPHKGEPPPWKNARHTRARVLHMPMGDIWLRDTGPFFYSQLGILRAFSTRWNGWGEKYLYEEDTSLATNLCKEMGIPHHKEEKYVIEGGAIEHDGAGLILSTESCLLNANRNKDSSRAELEAALGNIFGQVRVVWLPRGLHGDHTDGHIDMVARFIAPGRLVVMTPSDEGDPNNPVYKQIEADLRSLLPDIEVITVPSPGSFRLEGEPLALSHVNFLALEQVLVVPVYGEAGSAYKTRGERAIAILREHCSCDVVGLDAMAIATGGGAFHCASCIMPDTRPASEKGRGVLFSLD